jgi:hypothetical protein
MATSSPLWPRFGVARSLQEGLILRLKRSWEHIIEIEHRIESLRQANFDLIPEQRELELDRVDIDLPLLVFPDQMIAVFIGEVIHNLRSALDFLIYALAWIDSGTFQNRTQFPIEDSANVFEKRKSGKQPYLIGLNAAHVARIEQLQPYNGCAWTKRLRDLSNGDKHRELTTVKGEGRFSVKISSLLTSQTESQGLLNAWSDAEIKSALSGPITFGDGEPVVETLKTLHGKATNLLYEFDPIFSKVR